MKKYLSLLFVALFLCVQSVYARSKEVTDYINQQIEPILSKTLGNPSGYVAQKSQFMQLANQKEQANSSVNNAFYLWYIEDNIPNFRAGDWKRKEIEELETFFRNEFPSRFDWIDRVATLYGNQSISLTEDDKVRIDKLLRALLLDSSKVNIPGYLFMGETGDDGKHIYWASSNYSQNGEEKFSSPSLIHPAKFSCSIEGNDYSFTPRLPSVNEVKKLTHTSTPSLHITHERSMYLNEVNDDKIYVNNETNVIEFPTGAYWTASPEWSYEFKVPGLDINTGEYPIEAKMVNVEQYNFDREYHGKSKISPIVRLVISVDNKLIETVRAQKLKGIEEELNHLLSGYGQWGASVSEQNRVQLKPLVDFFNSIPQQITESNPFDYTLYKNILTTRDRNNQPIERPGSEFYTLEITLNGNGQKLATEISSKYVQLKQTSDTDFSIKPYIGDIFEVFRNPLISTDNLPDGISELVQAITHCQQEIQKIALAFEIGIQNPWEKDIIDISQQRYNINSASTYYKVGLLPNVTLDLKQVFSLKFNQIENVIYFDNPFLKPLKKGATVFVVSFKAKGSSDTVNLIFNNKKVNVRYKNRYYREENGKVVFEK